MFPIPHFVKVFRSFANFRSSFCIDLILVFFRADLIFGNRKRSQDAKNIYTIRKHRLVAQRKDVSWKTQK